MGPAPDHPSSRSPSQRRFFLSRASSLCCRFAMSSLSLWQKLPAMMSGMIRRRSRHGPTLPARMKSAARCATSAKHERRTRPVRRQAAAGPHGHQAQRRHHHCRARAWQHAGLRRRRDAPSSVYCPQRKAPGASCPAPKSSRTFTALCLPQSYIPTNSSHRKITQKN